MYKISFIDKYHNEYLGSFDNFTTDGRYNLNTIINVAKTEAKLSFNKDIIGFNLRKYRFSNPIIKTIIF